MALWGGTRGSAMSGGPHRPRLGKAGRFWRTERIGDLLIEAGLLFLPCHQITIKFKRREGAAPVRSRFPDSY